MTHNKFNIWIKLSSGLMTIFLLAACTTTAQNINKIEKGYDKKITEISLKMTDPEKLKHKISVSSRWGGCK